MGSYRCCSCKLDWRARSAAIMADVPRGVAAPPKACTLQGCAATERGGPFTSDAVNRLIKRIGERAGLPFPIHVHMLRHACGYALANAGHDTRALQDWLGHRSIQHTVRYTELAPTRFKDFWRD